MPAAEKGRYQGVLFNAFLALLVWVPLPLGSNRPWANAILEVWVYALAAGWLWNCYRREMEVTCAFRKAYPVVLPMVLWLLYCALQFTPMPSSWVSAISPMAFKMHSLVSSGGWMTISVDPRESVSAWFRSLAFALVFCLCLLVVDSITRLRQLAYVLVWSGFLQAFYGSFMSLSGLEYGFLIKKFENLGYASGTFVNRDHFAGYLEMCLAVGIGLMISMLQRHPGRSSMRQKARNFVRTLLGEKLRLRLYLAVMVIALVLTHSRMGNSAFFSSMIVSGIIGLILSRHATRSTVILLASLVVIDTFIVGAWFGVDKVVDRIQHTTRVTEADRINVDSNSIRIWKDYPATGTGAGSFYTVFPRYREGDIKNYFDHAHDDYLEFATESGLIGICLLGGMVVSSLIAALYAQYRRRDPLMRGMSFASIMGIIALLIHSSVDFNLHIPANALTFMVILSLGWLSLYLERD